MGIFKSKEKLYRLEVEGSYFSHSEGNLNLKELILKASENDPQLPIHKLVRSIGLGMLEMKADEYTDLEADNTELSHSLAIATSCIEEVVGNILEPEETYTASEYKTYTASEYKQAWLESLEDIRKLELDYFGLQKEYHEVKEVLRQARQDAMEAHAELDSLSEAWSNEQKLRKQADQQVLELSRELNFSKEREAEENLRAFEAEKGVCAEELAESLREQFRHLTATLDLQSERIICVPNEPARVEFVGDLLDRIEEAERKADEEYFKSLRNDRVMVVNVDKVFYKQVKKLKLESLPFKIQNLYKRFKEARELTAFEVSLCRGNRISDEAEEASRKFYKLGHELHDLLCKELRDKREACLNFHDSGLTGTDVEKLLKVQYEALQDLLKVVKKHVYP